MKLKLITALSLGLFCLQAQADNQTTNAATPTVTTTTTTQQTAPQDPATQNKFAGEKFLAANKMKPGVVTLPDGLQYKVVTSAKGAKPTDTDVVTVDYTGRFINGDVFDSSSQHGGPANFPVGQVIPGWTEALKLMPVGSTWEIFIPANLAYGEQGAPPAVGPNQTLVFKVKLIDFKKSG